MFFDQMTGPMGAGPAGLTSPGMNPNSLAALMAMGGGAGGPQMPGAPAVHPMGANAPGAAATPPPQQNILQMLMQMDPQRLRQMLMQMGLGGGPPGAQGAATGAPTSLLAGLMPGAGAGAMPGGGTGGLY